MTRKKSTLMRVDSELANAIRKIQKMYHDEFDIDLSVAQASRLLLKKKYEI